jgi:hypothetical protein
VRPRKFTDPSYVRAFREIVTRIGRNLGDAPLRMYVAGGAAVHFYTGTRISGDIDAAFSRRILPGEGLQVSYVDADGNPRLLYFDTQYNESFALVHEDAHADSVPLALPGLAREPVEVRLFSPLDLAVSKLARFADHDREDIRALARAGLIEPRSLRRRAEEALGAYVGDPRRIRTSIRLACELARKARRAATSRGASRPAARKSSRRRAGRGR